MSMARRRMQTVLIYTDALDVMQRHRFALPPRVGDGGFRGVLPHPVRRDGRVSDARGRMALPLGRKRAAEGRRQGAETQTLASANGGRGG